MAANTLSQEIAKWAVKLEFNDVPVDVQQRFMLHIIDAIGCAVAAIRKDEFTNVSNLAVSAPVGIGAPILGRKGRFVREQAAFSNGVLFHALDYDDTHGPAVVHPTAVSLAAALAFQDFPGITVEELFLACLAGIEVTCRVGMARHNAFHLHGFHPTSVVGTIGATVTVGKLLGLDADQMANAIGIAGSLSCGIFAYLDGTSNPKPIHAGQAAKNGVEAAELASVGVTGPETVFESRFGLYGAFLGDAHSELPDLTKTLGSQWESQSLSIKPYPACHAMQACLDCAAELQEKHTFAPTDIKSIKAFLASDRDINLVMIPRDVKVAPDSSTVGKFSLPYSMASLLYDDHLGIDSYDIPKLKRPHVLSLAKKIQHEQRDFETAGKALPGAVEITLNSGDVLFAEKLNERGGPQNPMSQEEILHKFKVNCHRFDLTDERAVTSMLSFGRTLLEESAEGVLGFSD